MDPYQEYFLSQSLVSDPDAIRFLQGGHWPYYESYNSSSTRTPDSPANGAEGLLYLFGLLFCFFAISVCRVMCYDMPRERRLHYSQQSARKHLIETMLVTKTVVKETAPRIDLRESLSMESPSLASSFCTDTSLAQDGDDDDDDDDVENVKSNRGSSNNSSQKSATLQHKKSNLLISQGDDSVDDLTCPICLCPFREEEKICWSNNTACEHTFHFECLEPWLMKHDECPCCRSAYLVPASKRSNHNEEAATLEDRGGGRRGESSSAARGNASTRSTNHRRHNSNNHDGPAERRLFTGDFHSWAVAFLRERASFAGVFQGNNPPTGTSRMIQRGDSTQEDSLPNLSEAMEDEGGEEESSSVVTESSSSSSRGNNNDHNITVVRRLFTGDFQSWAVAFLRERASFAGIFQGNNPPTHTRGTTPREGSMDESLPGLAEDI